MEDRDALAALRDFYYLELHNVAARVQKERLEQLPQLKGVRDMTDHTDRSQAYY